MNLFLTNVSMFMANVVPVADPSIPDVSTDWVVGIVEALKTVLWVVLSVVGAAGAIYAVFIGIKMAKADSADKRKESQQHLTNIIIAVVVVIALIIFFNVFLLDIIKTTLGGVTTNA